VIISRPLALLVGIALVCGSAHAEALDTTATQAPYAPFPQAAGVTTVPLALPAIVTNQGAPIQGLDTLAAAMNAASRGIDGPLKQLLADAADPVVRKIALWALADGLTDRLSFAQLDQSRASLEGWPRASRRQLGTEKRLATSGLSDAQVVAWFKGQAPQTAQGAMILASALRNIGKTAQAQTLISQVWRDTYFDSVTQAAMLTRFGDLLSPQDHAKRAEMLSLGANGPAIQALLPLLTEDQRQLAQARLSLRAGANLDQVLASLPPALAADPSLAYEKVSYLRQHGREAETLALADALPQVPAYDEAADRLWRERRLIFNLALRAGDYKSAYLAVTNHGFSPGVNYVEAEFFAGWLALSKLNDPAQADVHFGRIQATSASPITQSRAFYWRGRAADAMHDPVAAATFYGDGAKFITTFYGQLSAEKAGLQQIDLPRETPPTSADQARFEGRDMVQAIKMFNQMGRKDLVRTFVLSLDDSLPTAEECALLVDLAKVVGDQDLSMRVVRGAAQRGLILPERGYPVRETPMTPEAPEPAAVFGITRQESGFDPRVRSGVGAQGMMQIMPATAKSTAKRIGVAFEPARMSDPDYNMRLGSAYLGHMINGFGGSYVLAAAAYNAGPGRPAAWVGFCGDPRGAGTDPLDFIECIPFAETRNYVMRVMENVQVYRARLGGGSAPLTLSQDLRRGAFGAPLAVTAQAGSDVVTAASSGSTLAQP
jgi:soluble lytic murein transglycosylase